VRRQEPITRTSGNQPLAWVQYCAAGQRPHQQQKGKKCQTRRPVGEESHRAFVIRATDRCIAWAAMFGRRLVAVQPGVQFRAGRQHVEQQHQHDAQHRREAAGQRRLAARAGHRRKKLEPGYQSRQGGTWVSIRPETAWREIIAAGRVKRSIRKAQPLVPVETQASARPQGSRRSRGVVRSWR